jgi:hypothetical protein
MGECIFDEMARVWNHPVVVRSLVGDFSKGLLQPKTLANLDSAGQGPDGRFNFAQKVAYRTEELVEWMKAKYIRENLTADGLRETMNSNMNT